MTIEKINSLTQLDPDIIPLDGWREIPGVSWQTDDGFPTTTSAGDYTALLHPGAKLRWEDGVGGYGYGIVKAVEYPYTGSNLTRVTLMETPDFAFVTSFITISYSYIEQPIGWPGWFEWTPSITNFTASTLTGKWKVDGNHLFWEFYARTPTISGVPVLTLPAPMVTPPGSITRPVCGVATFLDSGVNAFPGWVLRQDDSTVTLRAVDASGTYGVLSNISSTVPFTWGTSDECNAQGNYEW